jgi:Outer membrane lipoprotein-sorting protein
MQFLKVFWITVVMLVGAAQANAQAPVPSTNGDIATPKMIAGKPYRISPGKEPGTFVVKWGDQSMTWTPKPWMEDRYRTMGPAYYAQWTQPGMPAPWDVSMDQRSNLSGDDLVNRCYAENEYAPYARNYWDSLVVKIYRPDGSLRGETEMLEAYSDMTLKKGYEYISSADQQKVLRKYIWDYASPDEVKGEGGVTTTFVDPHLAPQDTLYLPSVRKVRRLAGAVSSQYFPGLINRYEDVSHTNALPELNYKIVGFELFNPDSTRPQYRPDYLPEIKRVDGAGDVAAIVEITPKPGVSWWYSKRLYKCGLQEMNYFYDEAFDDNGKLLRRTEKSMMTGSRLHIGSPDGPPAPDWYQSWGVMSVQDFDTGFTSDAYVTVGGFDADLPRAVFSDNTLYREPKTLEEWLR